jgi:hypothetical protein
MASTADDPVIQHWAGWVGGLLAGLAADPTERRAEDVA